MRGDADLARVAELMADRGRSRMLMALVSGRELSASLLAEEAGISRPTASAHLKRLTEGGLIAVRTQGRNRHYRLAGPQVAGVVERMIELAPPAPITSLRESTRAAQLRRARTCYDHLAGQLGVGLMTAMLERGHLTGGDGLFDPDNERPASAGREVVYELTDTGREFLDRLGVRLAGGRRALVRYCVDWTETRHHLAGQVGRGLRDRFAEAGWVEPLPRPRALRVTSAGADVLEREFGVTL